MSWMIPPATGRVNVEKSGGKVAFGWFIPGSGGFQTRPGYISTASPVPHRLKLNASKERAISAPACQFAKTRNQERSSMGPCAVARAARRRPARVVP